ncbi:MAG TPA: hypothetical protein VF245_09425 [Solirubrobacterales bacterium]
MSIERRLAFEGARFDNTRALKLRADERVSVSGTSFSQSVSLRVESPTFHASAACFERGADVLLQPGGQGDFASASFLGPSLIATMPGGGPPAKISPLDGTRIERLVLQALDLSECTFGRLHRLDGLLISGRGQLSLAPSVVDGSYRREVLADEVVRRSHNLRPMLSWAPVAWNHPAALEEKWPPASSGSIADIYRAMRKAREDSADYPGATDFYYGEMEMRREGADNWVERLLLTGYWVLSGYGMRAARTLAAYVVLVLLIAAGLQAFGLQDPPSFWHTAAWTLTDSISLVRPTEHLDLTAAGMYLNFTIRIIGPALIALIVFALRSRVRR